MKKIINGRKYDTDTAEALASYWNGLGGSDFAHCTETLYRKKTGEFFLHGEGGPMSKYSHSYGNMTCGGEKIIPLTEDEAKEFVERRCDGDEYEAIFGPVEE